jgi:hypothetical protein
MESLSLKAFWDNSLEQATTATFPLINQSFYNTHIHIQIVLNK